MVPDRAQAELERSLRAMRPEVDPDFAARLDAWAAEGFPRAESGAPSGARRPFRLRPWLPRLAVAASLLVATVVGVGVLEGGGDSQLMQGVEDRGVEPGAAGGAAATESTVEPAPGTALPPEEFPAPPGSGKLRPGQERIQERDAQMSLATEPDQVDDVADGVVEVAERYDGIVASSTVDTSVDRGRATFDLRIPSQSLSAALADLSDLASVTSRNEATADITEPFLTAQDRFAEAKAEVDSLLSRLAQADTGAEADAVRARLADARAELASARAQLGSEKQRAGYSNVSVTVLGNGDADGWSFGDAVDDAGSVITGIAGALLVGLAAVAPIALIGAAIWFGASRLRRRSRERALDD